MCFCEMNSAVVSGIFCFTSLNRMHYSSYHVGPIAETHSSYGQRMFYIFLNNWHSSAAIRRYADVGGAAAAATTVSHTVPVMNKIV
jgi:hypothetical protein